MRNAINLSLLILVFTLSFPSSASAPSNGEAVRETDPERPISLYVIPEKWSYSSLHEDRIQQQIPSLLGIFDHREIHNMVVKLHSVSGSSVSEFMTELLQKRLNPGQTTIAKESGQLERGLNYLIKQRSFGPTPIITAVYKIRVQEDEFFLEVETDLETFNEFKAQVQLFARGLHTP